MIILSLSTTRSQNKACRGAALVELALSLPVTILIVLGTIHIGEVFREANVIIEAARHGARSAGAAAGLDPNPSVTMAPAWVLDPTANSTANCESASVNSAATHNGNLAAMTGACTYIEKSGLKRADWRVSSQVGTITEAPAKVYTITITVSPTAPRGPVDSLKLWLNLQPTATSVYPLEILDGL